MKLFNTLLISFCFLLFLNNNTYAHENQIKKDNFRYHAGFSAELKRGKLYRLSLSEDIISKMENYPDDLRIFDKNDDKLSFVTLDNKIPADNSIEYLMEIIDYQEDANFSKIILKSPENSQAINSISLESDNINFFKNIKIYGSNNQDSWKLLKEDKIYDFSSSVNLRNTKVFFPENHYLYYKMEIIDHRSEKNAQSSLRLQYQELDLNLSEVRNKNFRIKRIISSTKKLEEIASYYNHKFTEFSQSRDENANSVILLETSLPFSIIEFESDEPYYYRKIKLYVSDDQKDYQYLTEANIYKVRLDDLKEEKNRINFPAKKYKYLKILIENKDNRPLKIKNINLKWIQKDIYFIPAEDEFEYQIYFSNKNIGKAEYDFNKFLNQSNWFKQNFRSIGLEEIRETPDFHPEPDNPEKRQKLILIIIISLVTLILIAWIYQLSKPNNKKNPVR